MPLQKNLCHPINYNTFFEGNTEFIKKKRASTQSNITLVHAKRTIRNLWAKVHWDV